MNNELTFSDGTFAGQKIRVTDDGYASIYDVMKVAGVGRDPSTAWSELKHKLPPFVGTSRTSEHGNPTVKSFKFTGRGQRDTPVINGTGLVRLLFLLPGTKARQFVAESAETLVRYIGGDESLIEEIRHNRDVAANEPTSAQSFMRQNMESPPQYPAIAANIEIDLEERREKLVRMKHDNMEYKLKVLEKYKVYLLENVGDPRIKEQVQNEITNQILSTVGVSRQITSSDNETSEISIDQVLLETGRSLITSKKARIGRDVAIQYHQLFPGVKINTVDKYINGEIRSVNLYPRSFMAIINDAIKTHESK